MNKKVAETPKQFGLKLRKARIKKGVSLRCFAKSSKISPSYLSLVERGKGTMPTVERIAQFARALGEDGDEWICAAGKLPSDIFSRHEHASELIDLVREAQKLTLEQMKSVQATVQKFVTSNERLRAKLS